MRSAWRRVVLWWRRPRRIVPIIECRQATCPVPARSHVWHDRRERLRLCPGAGEETTQVVM